MEKAEFAPPGDEREAKEKTEGEVSSVFHHQTGEYWEDGALCFLEAHEEVGENAPVAVKQIPAGKGKK